MKKHHINGDVLMSAIHAKCLDCCGNARKLVERCDIRDCPLHPYRTAQALSETAGRRTEIDGQIDLFAAMVSEKGA